MIDSIGIKVEGEGEWNARKYGGTKRRIWRKIHNGKPWKPDTPRGNRPQRGPARVETLQPHDLASMVRGLPATGSRAAPNAITAEAASRQRCTVSNCRVSALWRGTSIVR